MTDLTTSEAVKAYIGKTDFNDDVLLQSLISAYSQWVRSFTNRDFTVDEYEIWRSGRGGVTMLTPQWPIVDVSVVEVDGRSISAAPSFGAYGYRFTDRMVTLSGGATFAFGSNNVRIVYRAGYSEVPLDISEAVAELVALRYKMRGDNIHWMSKSLNGDTVTLNTRDMPAQVATILKQYANPVPL